MLKDTYMYFFFLLTSFLIYVTRFPSSRMESLNYRACDFDVIFVRAGNNVEAECNTDSHVGMLFAPCCKHVAGVLIFEANELKTLRQPSIPGIKNIISLSASCFVGNSSYIYPELYLNCPLTESAMLSLSREESCFFSKELSVSAISRSFPIVRFRMSLPVR